MHKIVSVLAVLLAMLVVAPDVARSSDSNNYWGTNGGACVPVDDAIQNNRYDVTSGSIVHQSTNIDLIKLSCPIERNNSGSNPTKVWLSWSSPDVADASNFVSADFYRKARSTGTLTLIVTQDSSTYATNISEGSAAFTHTLDFNTYYYFMYVDVDRSSTSNTESFRGVGLGQ